MKLRLFTFLFIGVLSAGIAGSFVSAQEETVSRPQAALDQEEEPVEERISLDLKGVDIIELFRVLSLKTGITIVPSKGVLGRINVFLNNVTFEDALDVILVSQNLAVEKKNNILFVMTAEEYKKMYGKDYIENRKFDTLKLDYAKPASVFSVLSELKSDIGKVIVDQDSGTIILIDIPEKLKLMKESVKKLDQPLQTVVFDLDYAPPQDAKTQLQETLTPGLGEAIVDERSGKLIVTDLPSKIEKIRTLVKAIDEESRQVYIEAEIIQVTLEDKFRRGIEWEKLYGSKLDGLDLVGTFPVSPELSTSQNINVGTVGTDGYNATINFLQIYGDTKILSRPRIAVVNNEEAKILVGSREVYVTQSLSQSDTTVTSESVEFIDVGVKLSVTPTINNEGFITMKIRPEVSSVRAEPFTTPSGTKVPIVDTSEAETVVKVKDGTMIMIAGLIKEEKTDVTDGIPLLSQLPIIGPLFGTRSKELERTELVVFITPHLVRGDETALGLGLEKTIRKDIMPDDLKDAIILKEINDVITFEENVPLDESIANGTKQKAGDKNVIQDKLKGPKN